MIQCNHACKCQRMLSTELKHTFDQKCRCYRDHNSSK